MKHQLAAVVLFAFASACAQPPSASQTSATSTGTTAQPVAQASGDGPPLENGAYVAHGVCFGEGGCPWKHWRASGPVDVRASADSTSPVIATLAAGDWVEALDGFDRFIPRRGVVRIADQGLEVGDVIYLLETEGEGDFSIWSHGALHSWHWPDDPDTTPVQWDSEPDNSAPTMGWWVKIKLADDRIGWVKDPRFECMGPLGGDEGCRD